MNDKRKPIPRTDESARLALAKKWTAKSGQKNPDGLFELLALGTVIEFTASTANIMEPRGPRVRVKNWNLTNFGIKEERSNNLAMYAIRRSDHNTRKSTKERLIAHATELKNETIIVFFSIDENNKITRDLEISICNAPYSYDLRN